MPEKISSGNALRSPQVWLYFPVPDGFFALIREERALMFWESHDSLSIQRLGTILELKMAANSTYWRANLQVN